MQRQIKDIRAATAAVTGADDGRIDYFYFSNSRCNSNVAVTGSRTSPNSISWTASGDVSRSHKKRQLNLHRRRQTRLRSAQLQNTAVLR